MADLIYPTFKRALLGGTGGPIDFDADSFKVMLVDNTYRGLSDATKKGHDFINDVSGNEIAGTGYTAGGLALSGASIASDGADGYKVTFTNPAWNSSTIQAYGAVWYKDTGTPSTSPVMFFSDFGGAITSTNGTFTITIPGGGLFVLP